MAKDAKQPKKKEAEATKEEAKEPSTADAAGPKEDAPAKPRSFFRIAIFIAVIAIAAGVAYQYYGNRPLPSTVVDISKLRAWVNASGGFIHDALELRDFAGARVRGLFLNSNATVQAGEPLLGIPARLIMTCENHWLANYFAQDDPGAGKQHWCHAARLLLEKLQGPASPFAPWIELLPEDMTHSLWYYPEEVLVQLQDNSTLARIKRNLEELNDVYFVTVADRLIKDKPQFFPAANATMEAFKWAASVVLTRGRREGLIPVMDLLSHSANRGAKIDAVCGNEECTFHVGAGLRARLDIEPGDEVFVSYGETTSGIETLDRFGYVPDLEDDFVGFESFLARAASELDARAFLAVQHKGWGTEVERGVLHMSIMLRFNKPPEVFPYDPDSVAPPLAGADKYAREIDVVRFLQRAIADYLSKLPTIAEQDNAMINSRLLTPRMEAVVRARMSQKLICAFHLERLTRAEEFFRKKIEEEKKKDAAEAIKNDVEQFTR
eukprot:tig00020713_g13405.t1